MALRRAGLGPVVGVLPFIFLIVRRSLLGSPCVFPAAIMALLAEKFLHYRFLYLDRFSQASSCSEET